MQKWEDRWEERKNKGKAIRTGPPLKLSKLAMETRSFIQNLIDAIEKEKTAKTEENTFIRRKHYSLILTKRNFVGKHKRDRRNSLKNKNKDKRKEEDQFSEEREEEPETFRRLCERFNISIRLSRNTHELQRVKKMLDDLIYALNPKCPYNIFMKSIASQEVNDISKLRKEVKKARRKLKKIVEDRSLDKEKEEYKDAERNYLEFFQQAECEFTDPTLSVDKKAKLHQAAKAQIDEFIFLIDPKSSHNEYLRQKPSISFDEDQLWQEISSNGTVLIELYSLHSQDVENNALFITARRKWREFLQSAGKNPPIPESLLQLQL